MCDSVAAILLFPTSQVLSLPSRTFCARYFIDRGLILLVSSRSFDMIISAFTKHSDHPTVTGLKEQGVQTSQELALVLPSDVMSILHSAEPNEIVLQVTKCLQLEESALKEPTQEIKDKVRRLARLLKKENRKDVVEHLRKIVPAGTTGEKITLTG